MVSVTRGAEPLPPLSFNGALRYDVVERLLPDGIRDVLEIGCGRGAVGVRLASRYMYTGVEPDGVSCAVAREQIARSARPGVVYHGDVSQIPPDGRFDLVCAFEVIEHIADDRAALTSWFSHVRPGGWLLLSTPAYQHRFGAADRKVGHYRRYDPGTLVARLAEAGLADVRVLHYGGVLGYALEAGRNLIARLPKPRQTELSVARRSAGSGRWLQPKSALTGLFISLSTAPFRWLQRAFPDRGPGLIAIARRPER
jgi:SAM-dependent methyltransferase